MPHNIRSLVKEHHAFYEVSPYYVVLEEKHRGLPPTSRRVQAGVDVDVYGERIEDNGPWTPPPDKYGLGYVELRTLTEKISAHATDSCSLEVIPSPSTVVVDFRSHGNIEAMLRIRISHGRGLDQPAGLAEQSALEELEAELKSMGVARR